MFEDFHQIRQDIVDRLNEGATNRRSPCHSPVVATADADLRIMVLRHFDEISRTLRFHTDVRSPKCAVIGEGAPVGVLLYDKEAKVQMRCRGTGRILTDGPTVDAAWAASTEFARRCYLGDGPGTCSETPTSGLPEWVEGKQPSEDDVAPTRANFALLNVQIAEVDWLYLANSGHRRAIIDMDSGEGRWVSP